jgi:hypothetical protein
LYNLTSLSKSDYILVPLVGAEKVPERSVFSRRGLVISLAILALTVSLASRVSHAVVYRTTSAHSASVDAKIQHRDKDASEWTPPDVILSLLWVAEATPAPEEIEFPAALSIIARLLSANQLPAIT